MTAGEIIARIGLKPHPEGGHYAETFRDERLADGRPASTAIYYLLKRGERSTGEWSLAGCTVAPGFDFAQFELAPPDFDPR